MNALRSTHTIVERQTFKSHTPSAVVVSWPEYNADPTTYASLFEEIEKAGI